GEVIQMQLTAEPTPLSILRPETPPAFERLVKSMLSKEPARRPQNVAEVVALLDRVIPDSEQAWEAQDVAPSGETTIQRGHHPVELTTEEMPVPAPLPKTYSTNVQSTGRLKPSAVYATVVGVALVASGYGLYHHFSDDPASDGREEISAASPTVQPSPSTTVTKVPTPSATVAEVRATSPKPA